MKTSIERVHKCEACGSPVKIVGDTTKHYEALDAQAKPRPTREEFKVAIDEWAKSTDPGVLWEFCYDYLTQFSAPTVEIADKKALVCAPRGFCKNTEMICRLNEAGIKAVEVLPIVELPSEEEIGAMATEDEMTFSQPEDRQIEMRIRFHKHWSFRAGFNRALAIMSRIKPGQSEKKEE